jgi:hypothetical protein
MFGAGKRSLLVVTARDVGCLYSRPQGEYREKSCYTILGGTTSCIAIAYGGGLSDYSRAEVVEIILVTYYSTLPRLIE